MLENKIALVTGGGRGIGKKIAQELAAEGAYVVINYVDLGENKEQAEQTVKEISDNGGKAECYACDVADYTKVEEMIQYVVNTHGSLDILVNNAGITRDGLIMKMSEQDYDMVLNINLKGTFNCCRHVARQMIKQRGGRIINLSSIVGVMGNAGQANYAASKAGIIGLTKTLAKELGSRGITVNAIAPGYIDTDMTKVLPDNVKEKMIENIPMKRMGEPEDIANMVAFLASDKARYVSGQVIGIDGAMG